MKIKFVTEEEVKTRIKSCQNFKHVQQVAFSTYHNAFTQICFTCDKIRTSMKQGDLKWV